MKNYISWEHYEADRADRRTLLIWRIVIGLKDIIAIAAYPAPIKSGKRLPMKMAVEQSFRFAKRYTKIKDATPARRW